ncbi:9785_t:CDS:2, partial [Dentiscutata heterogama]
CQHSRASYTSYDGVTGGAIKDIPEVFLAPKIEINILNSNKKIKNLLKSYTLPVDVLFSLTPGQNLSDKSNYTILSLAYNLFTPASYSIDRHPNANYKDQNSLLNENISVYIST